MRTRFPLVAGLFVGILLAAGTTASIAYAASYNDLNYYQKQQFWMCWDAKCSALLAAQQYGEYRACSLACFDAAVAASVSVATCSDTDGACAA